MNEPKAPEPGPVTEMKPLGGPSSAKDREEARRNRLLENAAREARERKQQNSRPNSGEAVGPTSPTGDTAKLLDNQSPRAETPHGLAGMSISDILKMKDGPRKPRKIISS